MSGNLFDTVCARINAPERPFLHTVDGDAIAYGRMMALSAQYANALTELGVEKGDRVALQAPKLADCLWLYFACLRAGAVYLPLNPAYTPTEVAYFLEDARPRVFICDSGKADALRASADAAGAALETFAADGSGSLQRRAAAAQPEFDTVPCAGDDMAAILYTSGTTGRSKGAMISHENLRSNALALVDLWRFTAADVLLHILPVYHTHGLFVATNTVLMSGASLLFMPTFDVDKVITQLPRATTMMGVPTHYLRLLAEENFDADIAGHMRLFICGSAPLSAATHQDFTVRTGHAILERYGMTETNMITSNPYDGARKPGAVGMPLPGVETRVCDPATGAPLADGEVGVIEVKGPNVFAGYWNMPKKTAQEFRDDGFFITGDLGFVDPDGYLHISGRDKDLIISGGMNVYPAEVETALDGLSEIVESAVIGVPHPDFGEGVVGVVVAVNGADIEETSVRQHLERDLAKFKVPKRVVVVDRLPRNAMGKVQKTVLRETYRDLFAE